MASQLFLRWYIWFMVHAEARAAAGGMTFGVIADRIGRKRALMASVLIYSIFTAACGLAQGLDFPATVAPFILRGVTLAGINSVYRSIADRKEAWSRLARELDFATLDKMTPLMEDRGYINHIAADDPPEKVRASYGSNHGRLRQLKAQYDRTNLFRMNPNITPV